MCPKTIDWNFWKVDVPQEIRILQIGNVLLYSMYRKKVPTSQSTHFTLVQLGPNLSSLMASLASLVVSVHIYTFTHITYFLRIYSNLV